MSQHKFSTRFSNGTSVEVLAGWDRPLQYLFLVVQYSDTKLADLNGCVYSNLEDPHAPARDWGYYSDVLDKLGINEPTGFGDALYSDMRANRGNAIRLWSTDS